MTTASTASVFETDWEDLDGEGGEYEKTRRDVERSMKGFLDGKRVKPLAIVGPIGSGKTELLFHCFKHGWGKLDAPVFYTKIGGLLPEIKDGILEDDLPSELAGILEGKRQALVKAARKKSKIRREHFLPNIPVDGIPFRDYNGRLKKECGFQITEKPLKTSKKSFLLIDELEANYNELRAKVKAETGPLRELFESVGSGETPYYTIVAVGHVSAYELLSSDEAQERRVKKLHLPLLPPGKVQQIIEQPRGVSNFVWWLSRGRQGWIKSFNIDENLKTLKQCDNFLLHDPSVKKTISKVPVFDLGEYQNSFEEREKRRVLSHLICNCHPIDLKSIPEIDRESIMSLVPHVCASKALLDTDRLCDSFVKDVGRRNRDILKHRSVLERYFLRIIEGISSTEGKVCIGIIKGRFGEREDFYSAFIFPLMNLILDVCLDFEETRGEIKEFLRHFEELSSVVSASNVINIFRDTSGLVYDVSPKQGEVKDVRFISASLQTLRMIYPTLTTDPTVDLLGKNLGLGEQKKGIKRMIMEQEEIYERLASLGNILGGGK